ncbi:MAG: hypothetical protein AAF226_19730 [Verrucomicrobiota bacterium]
MNPEEQNDPVWNLLKENENRPEASPFFSRNVVREVRLLEDQKSKGLFSIFSGRIALAGAACAAIAVAAVWTITQNQSGSTSLASADPKLETSPAITEVVEETDVIETADVFADELETIDYIGQLMAVADPSMLSDEAFGDIFF